MFVCMQMCVSWGHLDMWGAGGVRQGSRAKLFAESAC